MAFKIGLVQVKSFPNEEVVTSTLGQFSLSPDHLLDAMQSFVCRADITSSSGYQQNLARELAEHLKSAFSTRGIRSKYDRRYCPNLNEQADVVLQKEGIERCIFIEIEFRPNVEKDLVKFQIGCNSGRLGLGILVLATKRDAINPGYKTMPEYEKFLKVIKELRPSYPLFVYGINGEHITPSQKDISRAED